MADPTPSQSRPERCASHRCRRAARSEALRRRPAAPGSRLCGSCGRALAADLAALPALHHESEQQLVLPARQAGLARVTGHRPDAPPVSDAALEARHDAVVRLASWARLVLDESADAATGAPPGRTVPELAAFLHRHVGFLAAHPAAGPAADEIAQVATALRLVVSPPKPELVPLGRCVEPGCDAEVSLPGRGGDDLVLRGPMCGAGHVLTPRQWLLLNQRQSAATIQESA
ncbi:uncharacterized protein SGFS_079720 [Streptomyces graminofaciens]|uniref:Uncharacterized protein n=1 Tax=Streptomyces graminofaciens TaxID=68212 RepID=A0ABN5VTZ0_9ACTN|nr:hypothetical protein [Streptomyces graminofaciens]BBC36678.1 uncharacterized protein SGFS_079720 [Streptomyces graminofaciens]